MKINSNREYYKTKIKITIEFKDESYLYEVKANEMIEKIFNDFCKKKGLTPSEFMITPKNINTNINLNSPIQNIIDKNKSQIFVVTRKKFNNISFKELNTNYNSIIIENIPAMNEFKKIIEEHITKDENLKRNTLISIKNEKTLEIDCGNEEYKNDLYNFINFIKIKDNKYNHITILKNKIRRKLKISTSSISNIKRRVSDNDLVINNKNQKSMTNIYNSQIISNKNIIPRVNTNKYDKYCETQNKQKQLSAIIKQINGINKYNSYIRNYPNKNVEDKLINDYYKNQEYIRNASPYLSEEDRRIQDEKQTKKLFINKKGFISSVGHYSSNYKYINNYVQMTPSENPATHNFRNINKKKWITAKGFLSL